MQTIDRALSREAFAVDPISCHQAAEVLRGYKRPRELHPWSHLARGHQLAFKLAFISICHEFNWDFLQGRLAEVLLVAPNRIAEVLSDVNASKVSTWLKDYHRQERVQAPYRAKLLRDVGSVLLQRWDGDADKILFSSNMILGGEHGFLAQLDGFAAYRADPLRKKSHVLVHDLLREEILRFHDEDAVWPAVDYHLMRLYLRTGRVRPNDPAIYPYLLGHPRPRPRLVQLLRTAVSEAARLTSLYSGLSVPDLNYVEWQLARAICHEESPSCTQVCRTDMPADISVLIARSCPYARFCSAHNDAKYSYFKQPNFKKGYY